MMPKVSVHNLRERVNIIKVRRGVDLKDKNPVTKATATATSAINIIVKPSATRSSISSGYSGRAANPSTNSATPPVNKVNCASVPSRLSTARNNLSPPVSKINSQALESRLATLESSISVLLTENSELKRLITDLQTELSNSKELISQIQSQSNNQPLRIEHIVATDVTAEQNDLNANIVIRGPEVSETTSESDLQAIFEGLRTQLGVSNISEFDPVSVSVIASTASAKKTSSRPILVKLPSVESKRKFLQVRRVKKDIFTADVDINSKSRRLLLVSEQLTKANQELLYQARSLRGENGFKFVWSTDGQVLARSKPNTRVIRIIDTTHINRLKSELISQRQDE